MMNKHQCWGFALVTISALSCIPVSVFAASETHRVNAAVSIPLKSDESMKQAEERAKPLLRLKVAQSLPHFIELKAHYDSNTDLLAETALVTQGGLVTLSNIHSIPRTKQGQVVLDVSGTGTVDVEMLQKKLTDEAEIRRVTKVANDNKAEAAILKHALVSLKTDALLGEVDVEAINRYLALVQQSAAGLSGAQVKAMMDASVSNEQSAFNLLDLLYLQQFRDAEVHSKVLAVREVSPKVAEVSVEVDVSPRLSAQYAETLVAWYQTDPATFKHVFKREMLSIVMKDLVERAEGKPIPPNASKYWAQISPIWQLRSESFNDWPDVVAVLESIKQRVLWLDISINGESLRFQMIDYLFAQKNNHLKIKGYMPVARLERGLTIESKVVEEIYKPQDDSLTSQGYEDLEHRFLRHADKNELYYRVLPSKLRTKIHVE